MYFKVHSKFEEQGVVVKEDVAEDGKRVYIYADEQETVSFDTEKEVIEYYLFVLESGEFDSKEAGFHDEWKEEIASVKEASKRLEIE